MQEGLPRAHWDDVRQMKFRGTGTPEIVKKILCNEQAKANIARM